MPVTSATVSPLDVSFTQVGPGDPGGEILGATATTPVSFYGGVPVLQQPGAGLRDGIPGTVSVVAVTVTVLSVPADTTNEQTFAVTGAAVGQLVVVQKPTVDAGIAIVGARASATGSVAITAAPSRPDAINSVSRITPEPEVPPTTTP